MDLGIAGRKALVCAASKGLGRACATSLAREGVMETMNARGEEALEAAAEEIRPEASSDRWLVQRCLRGDEDAWTKLVTKYKNLVYSIAVRKGLSPDSASDLFQQVGLETAANTYCSVQTWGTPEMILEKLRHRRELPGSFELNLVVNYGGLPFEEVEQSLRLFAAEALPELHAW